MLLAMARNSYVVKGALFVIIVLLLFNAFMISYYHHSGTTYIVSETYNKISDGISSSEFKNGVMKMPLKYIDAGKKIVQADARPVDGGDLHRENRELYPNGQIGRDEDNQSDLAQEYKNEDNLANESLGLKTITMATDTTRVKMEDAMVDEMIQKLNNSKLNAFFPPDYWNTNLHTLTRRLGKVARDRAKRMSCFENSTPGDTFPNWKNVHRNIRQFSLYDPDDPALKNLLVDLATLDISETEENDGGTELKLTFRFSNGGRAVMKAMRHPREVETNPNHYIFDDLERHIAEIAAFQLDKVLGFYRVPPTVGRWLNITELEPLMPDSVRKTVFTSPAGNRCFYGKCDYYCDSQFAFCGNPDMIEASIMSYLPTRNIAPRKSWYQPYRRAYSKFRKAYWETNDDLCDNIRHEHPYDNGKLLLDMIDAHTFDFLTGNKDRHSFSTFKEWGNYTFPILYDNGRGFGRKTYDAMSILAPLRQCCMIRKSTFLKYVKLYTGPERLSDVMRQALADDLVAPVLIPGHLNALDRRIIKILHAVAECIQKNPAGRVILYDQF